MGSEVKSKRAGAGVSLSIGERVMMDGRDEEFVVVDVEHASGRVELLKLKPGLLVLGVPVASLKRKADSNQGPAAA